MPEQTTLKLCFALVSMAAVVVNASATEDFFGDISVDAKSPVENEKTVLKGFVQQKLKYGTRGTNTLFDHERVDAGPVQVRTDLFAELGGDLNDTWKYRLSAKAEINYLEWQDNQQNYGLQEKRLFLRDAFLDASFDNGHWLRLGHQIFAWGKSESISISDVLAPTDQREFGQAELQDIREQIPAVMYQLPAFGGKVSAILTYDAGTNRYANRQSEFYPFVALKNSGLNLNQLSTKNKYEYVLKYDYQLNGGDFSFVLADINDNDLVFNGLQDDQLNLSQERLSVASGVFNKVAGPWLLKSELAYYANQALNMGFEHTHVDQIRGMVGAEYSGIINWRFSGELNIVANQTDSETLPSDNDEPGYTLHAQYTGLNNKLDQHLWLIALPGADGQVLRWDLNYDWSDSWAFSAGVVLYEADVDALLSPYNGSDTVNISAKYLF